MQNLQKIMMDIKKDDKYILEEILENNKLTDEEYIVLIEYILKNNIPEVKITNTIDENEEIKDNDIINENTLVYIKELLKNKKEIEKDDKYSLINIAILETIYHIKNNFNFIDVFEETYLNLKNIIIKYNALTEEYVKFLAKKYVIEYQKKVLEENRPIEIMGMLYFKIKMELDNNITKEDISRKYDISVDMLENIIKLYGDYSTEELDNEDIIEYTENILDKYKLSNIPNKFTYLEEQIIILTLGLEGKLLRKNDIAKKLNMDIELFNEMRNNAFIKMKVEKKEYY